MAARRKRKPTRASEHRKLVRQHREYYDALLELQDGCAICHKPQGVRRHALDHDHKTMTLRGVLCFRCNAALRYWVTPEWLRGAAAYLEQPPFTRLKDKT